MAIAKTEQGEATEGGEERERQAPRRQSYVAPAAQRVSATKVRKRKQGRRAERGCRSGVRG
eukprot:3593021-Pleurochrysis_carterae.AAC.1